MKYSGKKIIVLIFTISIFFLIVPKIAFATYVTFETNPLVWAYNIITANEDTITAIESTISAVTNVADHAEKLFEWAFQIAAEVLRRQLLNMIVDQIVSWIQGGGTPKFITDWPGFFRDAVDAAGGNFLKQMGLGLFCSPYNRTLRAAFIPIPQFSDRSACTLSSIGVNINDFLQNFQNGGWVAWNEMVLKPQNNIYGAYLMAWDEYEIEKSAAQKAAEAEAQAGKGFLSVKTCSASHEEPQWDEDGNPIAPKKICDQYQINTPGAVVGDLAGQALGSDIPYIITAKDFAAYVTAIANAVLNRMFAEGIGLLHMAVSGGGATGGGRSGGGSSAQAQCVAFLGTLAYDSCINAIQSGQDMREFQKNTIIKLIDQDLGYQNQLLGAKQSTLVVLNQSLDTLNQLEICQNYASPNTAAVKSDIKTVTGDIANIQSDIVALQLKEQQVKAVTDITQIPSLYAKIAGVVNPAATQSLALSAQNETSQKQTALLSYQQQLNSCTEEQTRIQQQKQQQQTAP